MDLAAHQSIDPVRIHRQPVTEQVQLSFVIGATKVDHATGKQLSGVKAKRPGEGTSSRGAIQSLCVTLATRINVARRVVDQLGQVGKLKALPDLGLPKAIEALDAILKARFSRRCKYRGHLWS